MSAREKARYRKYKAYLNQSPLLGAPLKGQQQKRQAGEERAEKEAGEKQAYSTRQIGECEAPIRVVAQVSTYVLAPAIDSFVLWVLQNAMKQGIRRLYFLARDGYFMYKAACQFCKALHLPIECRYLCCSRYSIRIPVFHLNRDDALEYICRGGIDVTMNKILERSGISAEECRNVLSMLNLPFTEEEVIPYVRLAEVRKELEGCQYFLECMNRRSAEAMPALQGYLVQEGLLDDVPDAVVDSGWVGSMQKTLNKVLGHFGRKRELEGYYWGLYELPEGVNKKSYHCYYFHPKWNLREKVYFSNCLFEAVFSAPHGMTLGYREEAGKFEPYFSECKESRKRFMETTEKYLQRYTEGLAEARLHQKTDWKRDRKIVRKMLKLFMGKPTKAEAETYGKLRFSDDVLDTDTQQVAALLTEIELRANHVWNKALTMLGIRHGYIKESAWYEGSAARYGKHVRYHRGQYAIYKYLLYIRKTVQG